MGEKDDVEKYKTRLNKRMQSRHKGDETGIYATKGSEETVIFSLLGNAGLCLFKTLAAISVSLHSNQLYQTVQIGEIPDNDLISRRAQRQWCPKRFTLLPIQ